MHPCPLSHKYEWVYVKATLLKPIILKVKSTFEPNVLKLVIYIYIIHWFKYFCPSSIKIFSNFQKEWCTFGRKKRHLKKIKIVHSWSLSALNMQKHFLFVSNFDHINFAINGKYSKKLWQSKLLCFPYDLSNVQKCNFEECPFTWVVPLTTFLVST
jgi:hypothetical protein